MPTPRFSQNDVCSYRKNLEEGGQNSIILVLKRNGLTNQQAMDRVEDMVEDCYQRWHKALSDLPPCDDEKTRIGVLRYVEGCRNIALENLHWRYLFCTRSVRLTALVCIETNVNLVSFYTPRYLKDEGQMIKETRIMKPP